MLSLWAVPAGTLMVIGVLIAAARARKRFRASRSMVVGVRIALLTAILGGVPSATLLAAEWGLGCWGTPAAFVVGVAMVIGGARRRYVGDALRCTPCNHALPSRPGDLCPACRAPLTPQTTAYGAQKRNRSLMAAGAATALLLPIAWIALAALTWLTVADTPPRRSFSTLMQQQAGGSGTLPGALLQCAQGGALSRGEERLLAKRALAEHKRASSLDQQKAWAEILATLGPTLSKIQRRKFARQLLDLELIVPERITQGRPLSVVVRFTGRGHPRILPKPVLRVRSIKVNGIMQRLSERTAVDHKLHERAGQVMIDIFDLPELPPGRHTIQYQLEVDLLGIDYRALVADFDLTPTEPTEAVSDPTESGDLP